MGWGVLGGWVGQCRVKGEGVVKRVVGRGYYVIG